MQVESISEWADGYFWTLAAISQAGLLLMNYFSARMVKE